MVAPIVLPAAAAINFNNGDVAYYINIDEYTFVTDNRPLKNLAQRDNILADKINEVITTLSVTAYDAIVGALPGDYASVFDALNVGAHNIFVRNGTWTDPAQLDTIVGTLDDIRITGESWAAIWKPIGTPGALVTDYSVVGEDWHVRDITIGSAITDSYALNLHISRFRMDNVKIQGSGAQTGHGRTIIVFSTHDATAPVDLYSITLMNMEVYTNVNTEVAIGFSADGTRLIRNVFTDNVTYVPDATVRQLFNFVNTEGATVRNIFIDASNATAFDTIIDQSGAPYYFSNGGVVTFDRVAQFDVGNIYGTLPVGITDVEPPVAAKNPDYPQVNGFIAVYSANQSFLLKNCTFYTSASWTKSGDNTNYTCMIELFGNYALCQFTVDNIFGTAIGKSVLLNVNQVADITIDKLEFDKSRNIAVRNAALSVDTIVGNCATILFGRYQAGLAVGNESALVNGIFENIHFYAEGALPSPHSEAAAIRVAEKDMNHADDSNTGFQFCNLEFRNIFSVFQASVLGAATAFTYPGGIIEMRSWDGANALPVHVKNIRFENCYVEKFAIGYGSIDNLEFSNCEISSNLLANSDSSLPAMYFKETTIDCLEIYNCIIDAPTTPMGAYTAVVIAIGDQTDPLDLTTKRRITLRDNYIADGKIFTIADELYNFEFSSNVMVDTSASGFIALYFESDTLISDYKFTNNYFDDYMHIIGIDGDVICSTEYLTFSDNVVRAYTVSFKGFFSVDFDSTVFGATPPDHKFYEIHHNSFDTPTATLNSSILLVRHVGALPGGSRDTIIFEEVNITDNEFVTGDKFMLMYMTSENHRTIYTNWQISNNKFDTYIPDNGWFGNTSDVTGVAQSFQDIYNFKMVDNQFIVNNAAVASIYAFNFKAHTMLGDLPSGLYLSQGNYHNVVFDGNDFDFRAIGAASVLFNLFRWDESSLNDDLCNNYMSLRFSDNGFLHSGGSFSVANSWIVNINIDKPVAVNSHFTSLDLFVLNNICQGNALVANEVNLGSVQSTNTMAINCWKTVAGGYADGNMGSNFTAQAIAAGAWTWVAGTTNFV